jgi:hypothetical protein
MNYNTLHNKNIITSPTGERYKDLISRTFEINESLKIADFFRVSADLVMDPAGISFRYYGTTDYADAIMKINEISNPFSIEEGDILVMVQDSQIKNFYRNPDQSAARLSSQFNEETRQSQKDKARLAFLKQKNKDKRNKSNDNSPSRILKDGESVFRFNDGKIILAGK